MRQGACKGFEPGNLTQDASRMTYRVSMLKRLLILLLLFGAALLADTAQAQADYGFRFVRVRFEGPGDGGFGGGQRGRGRFGGGAWAHDYPTAEENFYIALKRTTAIHVEEPYLVLELDDDRIFEYPFLYLCEPGYWNMTDVHVERLREYLKRGGFILFDDFRGEWDWGNFYQEMKRVFPDLEPQEIPPDHPIWAIYYDIDPVAAPSLVSGYRGSTDADRYMAYFDDKGRMMALANHNQDIGDGWEWPNRNFDNASTISFQMGINFVMYALTH